MRKLILLLAVASLSCATNVELFNLPYSYIDQPRRGGLELRFRNAWGYGVCLDPEQWPNHAGVIPGGYDHVFLIVGGQEYPMEKFDPDYCSPACYTRVAPGKELVAFIPYSVFGLPKELYDKPKQLVFVAQGYRCRK